VRKTQTVIAEIIQARMDLENQVSFSDEEQKLMASNFDEFVYNFFLTKYGVNNIAAKYAERFVISILAYKMKDTRINLINKFIGVQHFDTLPQSVLKYFMKLIKSTNIDVLTIFTADIFKINVNYPTVKRTFKSLIKKVDLFQGHYLKSQISKNVLISLPYQPQLSGHKNLSLKLVEAFEEMIE